MSAEVLIVGASTTGLTLACELLRRGIPLRLIDKNGGIPQTSRAVTVHGRTLEILADLGITEDLYALGEPQCGVNIVVEGEHIKRHVFPVLDRPFPYNISLPQYETERLLAARLAALGGTIERRTALTDLTERADGLSATLVAPDGSSETIDVSWVVGCDGAHSTVRHFNRQHFPGEAEEQCYLIADIVLEGDFPRNELTLLADRHGSMAMLPLPGGRYQVTGNWHPVAAHDPAVEPNLGHVQALLDERLTSRGIARDPSWISEYRVNYRLTPHYRHGRTFLAGDAAHIHSPFGGRGMNSGIQDGHNLGWKLAMVLSGEAPQVILDTYETERRPAAATNLKWTREAFMPYRNFRLFDAQAREAFVAKVQADISDEEAIDYHLNQLEFDTVYPASLLARAHVRDHERHKAFLAGPPPGAIAISAGPLRHDGAQCTLAELIRGTHFTLLVFAGSDPAKRDTDGTAVLVEAFADRFPGLVRAYLVVADEGDEPAAAAVPIVHDPDGKLHDIYGAVEAGLYLIRPDGHVGFRNQPPALVPLRSYCDAVFSCATVSPAIARP